MKKNPISVNFHLWKPCNYRCKFCFAQFNDTTPFHSNSKSLSKTDHLKIIEALGKIGIQKLTFAGGEPTLCPWLPELIRFTKSLGIKTMIITNGSKLTDEYLESISLSLDWCTISVDSLDPDVNLKTGRAIYGKNSPLCGEDYRQIAAKIKSLGIKLKINTVVHSYNHLEDFNPFIKTVAPERWKIFQVLPISGENDIHIHDYLVTPNEFNSFLSRHKSCPQIIGESNDAMTNSYYMIDPQGRFYNNTDSVYQYSSPILEVGVVESLKQVGVDYDRFRARGGHYSY